MGQQHSPDSDREQINRRLEQVGALHSEELCKSCGKQSVYFVNTEKKLLSSPPQLQTVCKECLYWSASPYSNFLKLKAGNRNEELERLVNSRMVSDAISEAFDANISEYPYEGLGVDKLGLAADIREIIRNSIKEWQLK